MCVYITCIFTYISGVPKLLQKGQFLLPTRRNTLNSIHFMKWFLLKTSWNGWSSVCSFCLEVHCLGPFWNSLGTLDIYGFMYVCKKVPHYSVIQELGGEHVPAPTVGLESCCPQFLGHDYPSQNERCPGLPGAVAEIRSGNKRGE